MLEEGVVTGEDGEYSLVEKGRGTACGDCSQKGACGSSEPGVKVIIKARNTVGASVGDRVQFSFDSSNVILSAFFVYIIPVLMLTLGSGLGSFLAEIFPLPYKNVYQVSFGLLFFLLSFFIVRGYNKRFEADMGNIPVITKIL